MTPLSPIEDIISDIRAGKMVVLVDDEDRENEGDLVIAADFISAESINFMAKFGRGLICLTLTEERCRQLELPLMVRDNRSPYGTAFTVSIEAATGVTTGISAQDRARTVAAAVARDAKPADIVQPGHIFPLRAQNGGVLVRAGHTEAGCDLALLAGLTPASVICEILKDDGTMARLPDLLPFAAEHGLKIGAIADLIRYRAGSEKLITRVLQKDVLTAQGAFTLCAFTDRASDAVHLALTRGDITPQAETLVRVHEPLSVLDFLDTTSPRHSFSIDQALSILARAERGVMVLLYHAQSGAELLDMLQHDSPATRPASQWDPRTHGIGAQILRDLGVGKMRVMANPRRIPSMIGFGLEVVGHLSPDEAKKS
jgi:3,4-dihydroxy 2-butanone 4-phosphate synthase/GTP cyclohydrolase II